MADMDEKLVNPDAPRAPGTPELPDLDVDAAQFLRDHQVRPDPAVVVDEPPD
jgi:hypothetical protein